MGGRVRWEGGREGQMIGRVRWEGGSDGRELIRKARDVQIN